MAQTFRARVIKARDSIVKALTPDNLDPNVARNADVWIVPTIGLENLKVLKNHSTILPQCIRAYKNNIAGFGVGVRYKEDVEETDEMKKEFALAEKILGALSLDMETKEVFEDVIDARETYGISYLEVLRNLNGEVTGIDFIKDVPSVQKSLALPPYVDVEFTVDGKIEKRKKKFCKYKQQIGGTTVYFKEFGDPRIMDNRSGEYVTELEIDRQANEVLEFVIGTEAYGEVRWIGQMLGIDGSRKAENLNNRYFAEGRHIPLMIMIKGGTLTDDSFTKLQEYMDGIKGEKGQHGFIVLEAASTDNATALDEDRQPQIKLEKLADILQKDELFQDYLDNNRRKIQSSFQLPDLYVGYTVDFNRATAQAAQEVTEEQVFQPERRSLAWVINNKLLAGYQFKHVEAYFKEPTISNPDDLMKILNVTERAGGLTPNKAKEIALNLFGETAEPYPGDWGDVPIAILNLQRPTSQGEALDLDTGVKQTKPVEKAHDDTYNVLKETRALLTEIAESGDIMLTNHDMDLCDVCILKARGCQAMDPVNCTHPNCPGFAIGQKNDSLDRYTDADGNLTSERQELHDRIFNDYFGDVEPTSDNPRVYTMLGGGSASGKGELQKQGLIDIPEGSVTLDADDIKTKIPEYQKLIESGGAKADGAAPYAHEESSDLVKRLVEYGQQNGYHVTLDATGAGSLEKMTAKINAARSQGMVVRGEYVTVNTEEAVKRSNARAERTGRRVPEEFIRSAHRDVSRSLPQIAHLFDNVNLFDNNGSSPVLIATGGNGNGLTPIAGREPEYHAFLAKADE